MVTIAYLCDISDNRKAFLRSLQLTPYEINRLQQQTIGQSESRRWRSERRKRLTASNFGRVFYTVQSNLSRSNLAEEILSPTPNSMTVKARNAIEYGLNNEQNAIDEYERLTKRRVKACGLFVHPEYGYLAASPDGLVGRNGILEVKCPYNARSTIPFKIPWYNKSFYCFSKRNSELRLKRGHIYYYQVQGQLEITDREWCDFVVWTRRGIHVERIWRDRSFWDKVFPVLKDFYMRWLLPEIVNSRNARDNRRVGRNCAF